MNAGSKIYGIIVEWKTEGPLIMECTPMTYEDASKRMSSFRPQADVIRVAMFRMIYQIGNETLIPKEEEL